MEHAHLYIGLVADRDRCGGQSSQKKKHIVCDAMQGANIETFNHQLIFQVYSKKNDQQQNDTGKNPQHFWDWLALKVVKAARIRVIERGSNI